MPKHKLVQHTDFCTIKLIHQDEQHKQKNFDYTGKHITETSLTNLKSVTHRKNQNRRNGKCEKRGSGTEAKMHKSKHAKVRNQAPKIRKEVFKHIAKNKTTFQYYTQF